MSARNKIDGRVSVVIRCHTVSRLDDLDECLFSLAGQHHDDVEAIIVTQNFSEDDVSALRVVMARYEWQIASIKTYNVHVEDGVDGRSELVNVGIRNRTGRYLAFLDFDDTVYANIYALLTDHLKKSNAAICFGATNRVDYFRSGGARHKSGLLRLFVGLPKLAVFIENQHPIHSYLIDTGVVAEDDLHFDVGESRNEDYAFLIRLLSKYVSDDSVVSTPVCDYYVNVDGGNTVMAYGATAYDIAKWRHAHFYIERIKENLPITTSYADLKLFMEWSSRKDNTDLADKNRAMTEKLAIVEAERNAALAQLFGIVEGARSTEKVSSYAIDGDVLTDGHRTITGWCSAQDGAMPTAAIIARYGKRCHDIQIERISRPDVAQHLSRVHNRSIEGGDAYGFSVRLPAGEPYSLRYTAVGGRVYELDFSVVR